MPLHPADQGARHIIAANRGTLRLIETAQRGVIVDIDSIEDVQDQERHIRPSFSDQLS